MTNKKDTADELIVIGDGQTIQGNVENEMEGFGVTGMPFDPEKIDVKTKSLTLDSLMKRLKHNEIELAPDFQRRAGLWSDEKKSRLIESILLRIPVPVFYFAEQSIEDYWLIVDGLQRLSTLKEFIDEDKPLVLRNLEYLSELENKTWHDLPRLYKRRFEEYEITVHIIQPVVDNKVMTSIFRRINTGGLPLSDQEIRHALFQGNGTTWLEKLAKTPQFLVSTNGKIDDKRMEDRECILRYFAFQSYGWEKYRLTKDSRDYHSLGTFLDLAMERLNSASAQDLNLWEQDFVKASTAASEILGKYAFRKIYRNGSILRRGPINKALYEAWMTALTELTDSQISYLIDYKDQVIEKFEQELQANHATESSEENLNELANSIDLMTSISANTGDTLRVHARHRIIRNVLRSCL